MGQVRMCVFPTQVNWLFKMSRWGISATTNNSSTADVKSSLFTHFMDPHPTTYTTHCQRSPGASVTGALTDQCLLMLHKERVKHESEREVLQ